MVRIKSAILSFFVLILLVPAVQKCGKFIETEPLKGDYVYSNKPKATLEDWFSCKFQNEFERYLKNSIGFNSFFVRFYNQIQFSFFNKANSFNTIVGKDNVLFQDGYIDSYLGKDYLGYNKIKESVDKIKFVQEQLAAQNVTFLFIIAPGKASFFSEYIPAQFDLSQRDTTNYDTYAKLLEENRINVIDFRKHFLQIKNKATHPLFPRTGTHWSGYAITLVVDSMFHYFEQSRGIDMPEFYDKGGLITTDSLRYTDSDIGNAMNLLWDIPNWPMYYPDLIFEESSNKKKPDILLIGDSFTQSLYGFYPFLSDPVSSNTRFWFYNRFIYWPYIKDERERTVALLDLKKETSSRDFIVVLSTEQNLEQSGFGFIDNMFDLLKGNNLKYNERINYFIEKMKNNPEWLESVRKKALERKVSLEQMLYIDAAYMVKQEQIKK